VKIKEELPIKNTAPPQNSTPPSPRQLSFIKLNKKYLSRRIDNGAFL
jgi:hypothetical protein